MSKLKVGVIGTGHLGRIHTKLWNENPDAELIGIFENNTERAQEISTEFSTKAFENVDDLIKECDALTIAVPTSIHHTISAKCLDSGKHCLIEKPITGKYSQAKELIDKADANNVIIQVGHVERFNPVIAAIKNYDINPMFIEAHRLSQFKPRATDVSVIHDLMIHDIDILLWLIKSEVSSIDANGVGVLTDTIDIANARINFKNGAVANVTASRISANPMRKMRIFQKNAYISLDFGKQNVEVFRLSEDTPKDATAIPASMLGNLDDALKNKNIIYEKPEVPQLNAIAEEQTSFINAINNNTPAAVGAYEASEALKIVEEIQKIIA
jgi:predicted dehydrogenase